MRTLMVAVVVLLIGREAAYAPFPAALRAVTQAACMLVGLGYIAANPARGLLARYWPAFGYLLVLMLTVPLSAFPQFSLFQVLSLMSGIVFAIAYFESNASQPERGLKTFVLAIILTYGVLAAFSVLAARFRPDLAYEQLFAGNEIGFEPRFRGVFAKAAVMGGVGGLLVGLAAIAIRHWILKLLLIVPGLLCLVWTQSRSFWIATLVAGAVVAWFYFPKLRRLVLPAVSVVVVVLLAAVALNVKVNASRVTTAARLDSVKDLTGRTEMWAAALEEWRARPVLGYGYTMGGLGMRGDRQVSLDADPTVFSRQTLHNGYVQSLMDSGLAGLFFYLAAIMTSIARLAQRDVRRRYPEAMYVVLFLAVANVGESIIFSGSVFQSLCYWFTAIFALSLRPVLEQASLSKFAQPAAAPAAALVLRAPPNLMK
jgi:O-antigen ligase